MNMWMQNRKSIQMKSDTMTRFFSKNGKVGSTTGSHCMPTVLIKMWVRVQRLPLWYGCAETSFPLRNSSKTLVTHDWVSGRALFQFLPIPAVSDVLQCNCGDSRSWRQTTGWLLKWAHSLKWYYLVLIWVGVKPLGWDLWIKKKEEEVLNVHIRFSIEYRNTRKEDGWEEGQQGTKSIRWKTAEPYIWPENQ